MNPSQMKELERLKKDKRKAEQRNDYREMAKLCNVIGEFLMRHGEYQDAVDEHKQELHLSESLEDVIGSAVANRKIGECFCEMNEYKNALKFQRRHLELAESCTDNVEIQRAWATIGRTFLNQSEALRESDDERSQNALRKSEESFMKSLEYCQRLKTSIPVPEYTEMKVRLLLNLGLVHDSKDDIHTCYQYIKQAISLAEKNKLHEDLYRCHFSMSGIFKAKGNFIKAIHHADQALQCCSKLKDKYVQSDVLYYKALCQLELGVYSSALKCLKQASKIGAPTSEERERNETALKAVIRSQKLNKAIGNCSTTEYGKLMKLYEKQGDTLADMKLFTHALKSYQKMLEYAEKLEKPERDKIPIYISLAQTYLDNKQYQEAIEYFTKELDCRKKEPSQACRTWLSIAECQEGQKVDYDVIHKSYVTALECANRAEHYKLQIRTLKGLSSLQQTHNHKEEFNLTVRKMEKIKQKHDIDSDDDVDAMDECSEDILNNDVVESDIDLDDISDSDGSSDNEERDEPLPDNRPRFSRKSAMLMKKNEKGETPLHKACIEGNMKRVKALVEQGHLVNPRDYCGWIPLHEAANHGFTDIVEYLIQHGANINDRGGDKCQGVTPLLDAASAGNLEVITVLVNSGANVHMKDDEGSNALDSLKAYRQRSVDCLTKDEMAEVRSVERQLRSIMQGNTNKITSEFPSSSTAEIQPESPYKRPEKSRATQRNTRAFINDSPDVASDSSLDEDDADILGATLHTNTRVTPADIAISRKRKGKSRENIPVTPDEESESDSENEHPPFNTHSIDSAIENPVIEASNARNDYKNAIDALKSSSRRSLTQVAKSTAKPKFSTNQKFNALISEDDVQDDWLIDDLGPETKKRKLDIDGVFSTSSTREHKPQSSKSVSNNSMVSSSRAPRASPTFEPHETFDDQIIADENSDEESKENTNAVNENNEIDLQDVNVINDLLNNDIEEMDYQSKRENTSNVKAKRKQLKMTAYTERTQKPPVVLTQPLQHSILASNAPSVVPPMQYKSPMPSMIRLKVEIRGKKFMIPVPQGDDSKTIDWLAQEAARRYNREVGVKPILSLKSIDGAIFAPEDPVCFVLSHDDQLIADVTDWEVPPLHDSYVQVCATLGIKSYQNIKTILGKTTNVLNLGNYALPSSQMQAIVRVTQRQIALKELNFAGNKLENSGLKELSAALKTLPNLTTLSIACNDITNEGLGYLKDVLSEESPPLQLLGSLDLSFNPLGDTSLTTIAGILEHLPLLSSLSLEMCEITPTFFIQKEELLKTAFKGAHLKQLNMASNSLGHEGVASLLQCLPLMLDSLTLDSTIDNSDVPQLVLSLQRYVEQTDCSLTTLSMKDCGLLPDNVTAIEQCLYNSNSLTTVDIS
ncbi:unnamed protein product [Owenia fusiformis]|uniref:Tonsoku-like protein n=1 Tax=Owenia fusiformis TaxID=6347 RepID=A0A8J1TTX1_OWEFU|nr:unnamed protein product [Owenia fusiformis]